MTLKKDFIVVCNEHYLNEYIRKSAITNFGEVKGARDKCYITTNGYVAKYHIAYNKLLLLIFNELGE